MLTDEGVAEETSLNEICCDHTSCGRVMHDIISIMNRRRGTVYTGNAHEGTWYQTCLEDRQLLSMRLYTSMCSEYVYKYVQ